MRLMFCVTWLFLSLSPLAALAADATSYDPTRVTVKAQSAGGVPVGTIVAWPVATNPEDWDKWLECNGQSITRAAYPALYAIVGAKVPDLRNRFLEGHGTPGRSVEAGLPNITGGYNAGALHDDRGHGVLQRGAFYDGGFSGLPTGTSWGTNESRGFSFDASRSNAIYGRSSTVQPPAYTVRYLIRAKP